MYSYLGLVAALVGLYVSLRILREKRKKTRMVCPLNGSCDRVTHSIYSTTFGIPNEVLGIAYYLLMACLYTASLLAPAFFAMPWLKMGVAALSFGGVLLSLYFLALQAFVIRAWCSWCVASALASFLLGINAWHLAGGLVRTFISHLFLV